MTNLAILTLHRYPSHHIRNHPTSLSTLDPLIPPSLHLHIHILAPILIFLMFFFTSYY